MTIIHILFLWIGIRVEYELIYSIMIDIIVSGLIVIHITGVLR